MPKAIDVHIHLPGPNPDTSAGSAAMRQYFHAAPPPKDIDELADYHAKLDIDMA